MRWRGFRSFLRVCSPMTVKELERAYILGVNIEAKASMSAPECDQGIRPAAHDRRLKGRCASVSMSGILDCGYLAAALGHKHMSFASTGKRKARTQSSSSDRLAQSRPNSSSRIRKDRPDRLHADHSSSKRAWTAQRRLVLSPSAAQSLVVLPSPRTDCRVPPAPLGFYGGRRG